MTCVVFVKVVLRFLVLEFALAIGAAELADSMVPRGSLAEIPLSWLPGSPLVALELSIGTPPQKVLAQVDSASEVLWVPETSVPGALTQSFQPNRSSSGVRGCESSLGAYADGTTVAGHAFHDLISLGGVETGDAPLLVANSASGTEAKSYGIFGLGHRCKASDTTQANHVEGFFCHFWRKHPEMRETMRLALGGVQPRMFLGEDLQEGPRAHGGVRFLKNTFSSQTSLWYAPLGAMGFSWGNDTAGANAWAIDFTTSSPSGAAALLDSGAGAIRVSSSLFEMMVRSLPEGCHKAFGYGILCPCADVSDFPSLAFSFEGRGDERFLGVDAGSDIVTCVSPDAYVSKVIGRHENQQMCSLAILDAGPYSIVFDTEAVVLGVPFFRGVEVAYDNKQNRVAIGTSSSGKLPGGGFRCVDPKSIAASRFGGLVGSWVHFVAISLICGGIVLFILFWGSASSDRSATATHASLEVEPSGSPQNGAGSHMSRLLRDA